jgi:hypothetical protein
MAEELERIDFEDFAGNVQEVFRRVRERNQPVLVERDGEVYRLEKQEPDDIWRDYDPEKVQQALTASRGMFAGSDPEKFLREIDEQREQGPNRFD